MDGGEVHEPLWVVWSCSWGICGRSWTALRPMLEVLGCSWGLCWWSWVVLGRNVAQAQAGSDLAGGSGPKVAKTQAGRLFLGSSGQGVFQSRFSTANKKEINKTK